MFQSIFRIAIPWLDTLIGKLCVAIKRNKYLRNWLRVPLKGLYDTFFLKLIRVYAMRFSEDIHPQFFDIDADTNVWNVYLPILLQHNVFSQQEWPMKIH